MRPLPDSQDDDALPVWGYVWAMLPRVVMPLLVGLASFTATLEYRSWVYSINREAQRLELGELVASALKAEALENDVIALTRLQADLQDWREMRTAWAGPLSEVQSLLPAGLELTRVGMRGSLGGDFAKPNPTMPARFVPRRDFRILIEGAGRSPDTAGDIADFSRQLASSGGTSNYFGRLELQGIINKSVAGEMVREFSLLATGSAGKNL